MGNIYVIKLHGKPVYVGQTIKTIEERFDEHIKTANSKKAPHFAIHRALLKYGIENFSIELVEQTEQLNEREKFWIKELHTLYSDGGYNLTIGGEQCSDTIKCKCYQYDKNDGHFIAEYNSISEAGRLNQISHANIIKVLQGEINIAGGYRWSKIKTDNLDFKQSNYTGSSKPVAQYDLKGNLLNIYPSVKDAAKKINYSQGTLAMAAEGKRKTAKGFVWKYVN